MSGRASIIGRAEDAAAPVYPADATYAPHDWSVLARYWHPVALSEEVDDARPWAATLLDVPLVLYRLGGALTVALDRCPHRGTRLSLGRLAGDRLVCPYHGLAFDGAGACVAVPTQGEHRRAPYLDVPTFRAEERHGLVWVCLSGDPAAPLPDWSAIEAPGQQRMAMQDCWNASAGRHVENFCDIAHFAFAHAGTFGVVDRPRVPPFTVEQTAAGFFYDVTVDVLDAAVFGEAPVAAVRSEYHVTLPFATRLTLHYSRGIEHICDAASPISAGRTRIFILKARDHDFDEPLGDWVQFQLAVNAEDRAMVESQVPNGLPLAGAAEKHLASDVFASAYRRHWAELGLSGPI